jgi:uncharacterized protein (DUF697 family)
MSKKLPGLQRINRPKVGDRSASASEEVRGSEKKKNTDKPSPSKETATVSRKKRKPKNASHSLDIAPSQSERINPLKAEKIIPPKQPADDPANSKKSQVIDQNDKLRLQNHKAKQIITRYAAWSSAGGLIPLPYADIAAVTFIQARMVMDLAVLYKTPVSRDMVKVGVASVVGSTAPHTLSASAASMFFKSSPGFGTIVGMVGMAGLSNLSTRIVGRLFAQHFAAGYPLQQSDLKALNRDYQEAIARGKDF